MDSGSSPAPTSAPSAPSLKPCTGLPPDIAGQDKANPTAVLQSAVLMLHHIDESAAANKIQTALEKVYAETRTLTRDVGGTAGTRAFGEAVIAAFLNPSCAEMFPRNRSFVRVE